MATSPGVPLPKLAAEMTTAELLRYLMTTFAQTTAEELPKNVRIAATTAHKQVIAELAKRIDRK